MSRNKIEFAAECDAPAFVGKISLAESLARDEEMPVVYFGQESGSPLGCCDGRPVFIRVAGQFFKLDECNENPAKAESDEIPEDYMFLAFGGTSGGLDSATETDYFNAFVDSLDDDVLNAMGF